MAAGKSLPTRRSVQRPGPALESERDGLARAALAGMELTAVEEDANRYYFTPDEVAARAYAIADAMLRQRERSAQLEGVEPVASRKVRGKAFAESLWTIGRAQTAASKTLRRPR